MNTKDLICFKTIYEERSIHRAAKRLFITPQGLSKHIRLLEDELHTTLFERTKQGVSPTRAGDFLYEKSGEVIRNLEEIEDGIRQLEHCSERLRIGCAHGVFNLIPIQTILDFIRISPELHVEWSDYANEEVKELLLASRLDYGIIVGADSTGRFSKQRLASCDIVLYVYEGHPLYDYKCVTPDLLREENLVLMNEQHHMFHVFVDACKLHGFSPKIVARTGDAAVMHKVCSQKIGLGVAPAFLTASFSMEHMHAIPFEEAIRWEVYGVCQKNTSDYPAIRKFDEFLRNPAPCDNKELSHGNLRLIDG